MTDAELTRFLADVREWCNRPVVLTSDRYALTLCDEVERLLRERDKARTALRYGSVACNHPDHVEGQSCEDRAVACHPDCVCCRPNAAALERDEARAECDRLRAIVDRLKYAAVRSLPDGRGGTVYLWSLSENEFLHGSYLTRDEAAQAALASVAADAAGKEETC